MQISWSEALENRRHNRTASRFPSKDDPLDERPWFEPRFYLNSGAAIFTIGSCFARNIEEKLTGFDLPTTRFAVPNAQLLYEKE